MSKTTNGKDKAKEPEPAKTTNPFSGFSRFGNQNPRSGMREVKPSAPKMPLGRPTFITQHKGGN